MKAFLVLAVMVLFSGCTNWPAIVRGSEVLIYPDGRTALTVPCKVLRENASSAAYKACVDAHTAAKGTGLATAITAVYGHETAATGVGPVTVRVAR